MDIIVSGKKVTNIATLYTDINNRIHIAYTEYSSHKDYVWLIEPGTDICFGGQEYILTTENAADICFKFKLFKRQTEINASIEQL